MKENAGVRLGLSVVPNIFSEETVKAGHPSAPMELNSKTHDIGQGNIAFIFPNLSFGCLLARVSEMTDDMVTEAAFILAAHTGKHHLEGISPMPEILKTSRHVAVIQRALKA